jgi:hypothetical protein
MSRNGGRHSFLSVAIVLTIMAFVYLGFRFSPHYMIRTRDYMFGLVLISVAGGSFLIWAGRLLRRLTIVGAVCFGSAALFYLGVEWYAKVSSDCGMGLMDVILAFWLWVLLGGVSLCIDLFILVFRKVSR